MSILSAGVDSSRQKASCGTWRPLRATADFQVLAARARGALALSEFQHDPEWVAIAHSSGNERPIALVDEGDEGLRGLLVGHLSDSTFEYMLAGRTLLRKKVRQLTVHQGPVVSGRCEMSEVSSALNCLAELLPRDALVYFSAVPVGSPLHRVATAPEGALGKLFRVMPWGGEAPHYKIQWKGTVESYLRSLHSKKRGNVRRAWQRFKAVTSHTLKCFRAAGEVDDFLRDASAAYAQSDRGDDPDLGPLPHAGQEALIRFAARQGAFLGYILYAAETPIAYRYGFVYDKTYFAISTAFDRRWSEHMPGSVIFFDMLLDLEKTKVPVEIIDLLPHGSSFKRDRANITVPTQNFYLFGSSNLALYRMLRTLETLKPLARGAARLLQAWRKTAPQLQRGNVE
jgi:hypothetical protein